MRTLVTGALPLTIAEQKHLKELGLELTLHPDERIPVPYPEQFEAVICNGLFQFQDISAFTNLRFLQLTSAGMDRVPLDYIKNHGIKLSNAHGVYAIPMAEWTLMTILEFYHHAHTFYDSQNIKLWKKDRTIQELTGKTACIIGFGAYGQEVARRLGAFDIHRIVVNRTLYQGNLAEQSAFLSDLDFILPKADIVILALALTPETIGILTKARLRTLKAGAFLVNAARGALIDQEALIQVLSEGHLGGAALDVFQEEPLPTDSPLWSFPQVRIFPHNAFVGENNHKRLMEIVYAHAINWRNFLG